MLLAGLALVSCNDFLDEQPQTTITSAAVFGDDSSALAAETGVWACVCQYNYYAQIFWEAHNLNSTEYTSIITNGAYPTQLAGMTSGASLGTYKDIYLCAYKSINAINVMLDKSSSSNDISASVKKTISASGHLLRAMLYFNLVREFGPVPLVTGSITKLEEAHVGRSSKEDVYSQIINDLDVAFNNLPEPGSNRTGYPHKWAAKALLAKVYLTMANGEDGSPYWQKCFDTAREVYEAGVYSLVRPFADLWDPAKENSVESIIEFQLSEDTDGRLMSVNMPQAVELIPKVTFNGNTARIRLMPEIYDDFIEKYPDDPRIEVSILHTGFTRKTNANGGTAEVKIYPNMGGWSNFPFCRKFLDTNSVGVKGANNFVYMRYADLLLILAESANELGRNDAKGYVDEVLDRARDANGNGVIDSGEVQPSAWTSGMSKEEFRDAVMQERRFELIGECHSWFDERRRGEDYLKKCFEHHNAHKMLTTHAGKAGVYRFSTEPDDVKKFMLWPIPADEITNNSGISQEDQNFGW